MTKQTINGVERDIASLANLGGANLGGAYLGGTKEAPKHILQALRGRCSRSDDYEFLIFQMRDGEPVIRAGCRTLTVAEYRTHVEASYPDTPKATETLCILTFLEARAVQVPW